MQWLLGLLQRSPPAGGRSVPRSTAGRGTLVEHVSCPTDPTQTYTLYLPSTYQPITELAAACSSSIPVAAPPARRRCFATPQNDSDGSSPRRKTRGTVHGSRPCAPSTRCGRRCSAATPSTSVASMPPVIPAARRLRGCSRTRPARSPASSSRVSRTPNRTDAKGKRFAWFGMAGHSDFNFHGGEEDRRTRSRERRVRIAWSSSTAVISGRRRDLVARALDGWRSWP